ncbi:MAG: hypothetical protein K6G22_15250 [Lachnospiraceae bacterium]|nr:hypothetical protein [Lachnospiraceae bacterium]
MEEKKSNKLSIVIGVIALMLLGYVLFVTLYSQIIAQNEGFFYIFLFGGILVLVFVLLTLIIKLIAISPTEGSGFVWNIAEALALIVISIVFFVMRFQYSTSMPVDETLFYKAASFMYEGTLSGSLDIVNKLLRTPIDMTYARVLSIVFMVFGERPDIVIYMNAVVIMLCSFFAYRCARQIGGRLIGLITFFATLFIPSQSFGVYSYYSEYIFALFIFICMDIYLKLLDSEEMNKILKIIHDVLLGINTAVLLTIEPVAIIFVFNMILHTVFFKKNYDRFKHLMITTIAAVIVFSLLVLLKVESLGVEVGDVFSGFNNRFDPTTNYATGMSYDGRDIYEEFKNDINDQTKAIMDNYYFMTKRNGATISPIQASWMSLGTNLLYMFILVLCIGCVFFMIRVSDDRVIPLLMLLIGIMYAVFVKSTKDYNSFYFFEILIVIGCCGLRYMYENHHPYAVENLDTASLLSGEDTSSQEGEAEEFSEEEQEELMRRARALIFVGDNEVYYEAIKKQERKELEERIKNRGKKPAKSETEATAAADESQKAEKAPAKTKKTTEKADIEKAETTEDDNYASLDYASDEDADETSLEENIKDKKKGKKDKKAEKKKEGKKEEKIHKPAKGEMLENPLPVPKKHKSKPMEFDEEVKTKGSDDFDFDYNDDDFDY